MRVEFIESVSSPTTGRSSAWRLPARLVSDLRTDHAGETGAVMIYRGILASSRDPAVRAFAHEHLATEAQHLATIERLLPPRQRSRLLPLWRAAGWLTGALPAWVGPRAVFATIEAVETFVDHHYTEQINTIDAIASADSDMALQALRAHLCAFRADEVEHRDEAAARFYSYAVPPSPVLRLWIWAVGASSRRAVAFCRWI